MKKAKILINRTISSDMKYKIYRFLNEPAKQNLEDYIGIEPIDEINEEDIEIQMYPNREVVPTIIDNGPGYDYLECSLPNEFIYKNDFFTINFINKENLIRNKIEIYIGPTTIKGITVKEYLYEIGTFIVTQNISDITEMNSIVILKTTNSFDISKEYIKNYVSINLNVNYKYTPYIDYNSSGLYKPKYISAQTEDKYILYQDEDTAKNIYSYSVIGETIDNKITNLSNISTVELKEEPGNITTVVEVSNNYCDQTSLTEWEKAYEISSVYNIEIFKNDMASNLVPNLYSHEISIDDSNVGIYNERVIILPNIWHKDKISMNTRKNKAYRFFNKTVDNSSDYSDIFYIEGYSKCNIDKMTIYKKRVTYLNDEEKYNPISTDDSKAILLKVYVRSGGIYHEDAIINAQYQPVSIISSNSNLPLLKITDSCYYSNDYNYTIYVYDEYGKQSKPCVIVR